jgi:hypothetical protein
MDNDRFGNVMEQKFSRRWGETACALAFQTVDRPTFVTAQTLNILALFWFGLGEFERAEMHCGIASQVVQSLGLHRVSYSNGSGDWLDQELQTRVFWGAWQIELFATLKPGYIHPLVYHAMTKPLPSSEEEFESKKGKSDKVFRLHEHSGSESVLGQLMQACQLWYNTLFKNVNGRREVVLNATKKLDSIAVEAVQLGALESKACSWYSAIPSQLRYTSESLLKHIQLDTAGAFILIHVIHNASLAVLRYSLALSIAANPQSSSSITVTMLTRSALEHANAISNVIEDILESLWDISRTPGFVGHAAYIATAIQLSYAWSSSSELARHNINNNLRLLKDLSPYAKVVEELVFSFRWQLIKSAKADMLIKSTETRMLDAQHSGNQQLDPLTHAGSSEMQAVAPLILRFGIVPRDTDESEKQLPAPSPSLSQSQSTLEIQATTPLSSIFPHRFEFHFDINAFLGDAYPWGSRRYYDSGDLQ